MKKLNFRCKDILFDREISYLEENLEIFKQLEIKISLAEELLKSMGVSNYSNVFGSSKCNEIQLCWMFGLSINQKLQGVDAKDIHGRGVEIKNISKGNSAIFRSPLKDVNGEVLNGRDWSDFLKFSENLLKNKLSGDVLLSINSENSFGFDKILKGDGHSIFHNILDSPFWISFQDASDPSAHLDPDELERYIKGKNGLFGNRKIPGEIYGKSEISKLMENLSREQKQFVKILEDIYSLFQKVWCVELVYKKVRGKKGKKKSDIISDVKYKQGLDPFNSNNLNEFRAAVYLNSLCVKGRGPDAINENGELIELKIVDKDNSSARVDLSPKIKDKDSIKFIEKLQKKFFIKEDDGHGYDGYVEKSIAYYVFVRDGSRFIKCLRAEGSILYKEYKPKAIQLFKDRSKGKSVQRVNVHLYYNDSKLFKKVNIL